MRLVIIFSCTVRPSSAYSSLIGPQTHLQDPVPRLQAAIFDGGPTREDVLHQDGSRPVHGRVSGYHGEAQPFRTCGERGRGGWGGVRVSNGSKAAGTLWREGWGKPAPSRPSEKRQISKRHFQTHLGAYLLYNLYFSLFVMGKHRKH